MSRPDPSILEQAIGIVHSWEAANLRRLLSTAESESLIRVIARELQSVLDDDNGDACKNRDLLDQAYDAVDAFSALMDEWRLNAAEAATLAECIARALAMVSDRSRPATPADSRPRSPNIWFHSENQDKGARV